MVVYLVSMEIRFLMTLFTKHCLNHQCLQSNLISKCFVIELSVKEIKLWPVVSSDPQNHIQLDLMVHSLKALDKS